MVSHNGKNSQQYDKLFQQTNAHEIVKEEKSHIIYMRLYGSLAVYTHNLIIHYSL